MFPLMFLVTTIKYHTVFILDKPLVMTENDHEGFIIILLYVGFVKQ